jgi:CBS domain-containing protein
MSNNPQSAKEMIDALVAARDRIRVQAHLFSLDAMKRWQPIERTLVELQSTLEASGERVAANAASTFREVAQAAKDFFQDVDGSLELGTPLGAIMHEHPVACAPADSLSRAAQIMWEHDCGAVPVVATEGSVIGIVTDRDICMAAYTRGQPLPAMTVESVMSRLVYTCSPEDSIGHAVRLMAHNRVRRLPVVENGKLVGFLSLADIAREVRKSGSNRARACLALAHLVASISATRDREAATAAAE